MKKRVLVYGFGHVSLNKKDIAVRVIDFLRDRSNVNNLELIDSTTCDKDLSSCIESAEQLIVIDSNHAQARKGSVRVYEGFEMDAFVKHRKNDDAHEAKLCEALSGASRKGKLPRHRALVGIDPVSNEMEDLNEVSMNYTINRACQKVFEITEYWKI